MKLKEIERKCICSCCSAQLNKGDKAISFKNAKSNPVTINLCQLCCNAIKEEMINAEPTIQETTQELTIHGRILM